VLRAWPSWRRAATPTALKRLPLLRLQAETAAEPAAADAGATAAATAAAATVVTRLDSEVGWRDSVVLGRPMS